MTPKSHDPISEWMTMSQERMPITDMEHLILADIHAIAKKRAVRRRYLAFGWLSFLIGAGSGLWLATQMDIGLVAQVGIVVALMFGLEDLWKQSRGLKELPA